MTDKLWGGRFSHTTNACLEQLNSSIRTDKRLYLEDIVGSQSYAKGLQRIGLLTDVETNSIANGLNKVKNEWDTDKFVIEEGDEDIHTANERRLKEFVGYTATKLHVGRSRNDQVATDMKLWLLKAYDQLHSRLHDLIKVMIKRSENEIHILMPGYTHLQRAQPIRWSHWILSHAWGLKNDAEKLKDLKNHTSVMPLGSGALAGNPFGIDRYRLATDLGFKRVTENSMHAVKDRDFIADFLYWGSLVSIHLSQLAEDLLLYATTEFGFVTIDESFSTGSSLMPHKKNPDSLELIRSASAVIFGELSSFMMTLKSLPSTYNKDLQNDKSSMFVTFDKLNLILEVSAGVLKSLKVNAQKCKNALNFEMLATDLAYYLVRKNIPFREAHYLAGKVVSEAEHKGVYMYDLTLEELKTISPYFDADVSRIWNYEHSVEQYQSVGGTSKAGVAKQIEDLSLWLGKNSR